MNVIYETHGRAREYFDLAANLYSGCSHGCVYCFGPDVLHQSKEQFFTDPRPRKNVIQILKKDANQLANAGETRAILLSFVTDPYQPIDDQYHLTRQAIETLKSRGLRVAILTKGGRRAVADFDLLGPGDEFGTTLTFDNPEETAKWEPGAASYVDRACSLLMAHDRGIRTFVSLEPIIRPKAAYEIIDHLNTVVDFWKVGKINYHEIAKTIDWKEVALKLIKKLDAVGADYYIKKDLAQYIGQPEGILKINRGKHG